MGRKQVKKALPSPKNVAVNNGDAPAPKKSKSNAKSGQTTKRVRPADVEASKPVNSPPKKRTKPGTHLQLTSTIETDDDETAAALPARSRSHPRPRLRGAALTTSTAYENAQVSEGVDAGGDSPSDDDITPLENTRRQRLADALADEDARATGTELVRKERVAMARAQFAARSSEVDNGEEDLGSDDEDVPATKGSEASKV
jgi:hypothetical protein